MEGNRNYHNRDDVGNAGGAEAKFIGGVPECRFHRCPVPVLLEGFHRVLDVRLACRPGHVVEP